MLLWIFIKKKKVWFIFGPKVNWNHDYVPKHSGDVKKLLKLWCEKIRVQIYKVIGFSKNIYIYIYKVVGPNMLLYKIWLDKLLYKIKDWTYATMYYCSKLCLRCLDQLVSTFIPIVGKHIGLSRVLKVQN